MARSGMWVWALASCTALSFAKPSGALPPNACAPLFDPNYDYANVAYANVKISDDGSACFLVPRNVIHKDVREFDNIHPSVALDPADLLSYLSGKTSIKVGTEERRIDQAIVDCLAAPVPDGILISGGPPLPSRPTVAALKSGLLAMDLPLEEAASDLPGYRRYVSQGPKYQEEYYFPDSEPDPRFAFWCGNFTDPETCSINGGYEGMAAAIRFRKDDMKQVRPNEALACVGRIGDLFRIDNDQL